MPWALSSILVLTLGGCLGRQALAMSWEEAHTKAQATLALMTREEKQSLLHGVGWDPTAWFFDLRKDWYVGGTPAIPRLGLPSLNMGDASAGFRTYWSYMTDTVTVWPSLLALAATFDPELVRAAAEGIGQEFSGKGANGILGPSVNVHRVARNGRNFEYLSGEDPYLGSLLAKAYVEGVQSQGVLAVLKHWVFNSQETKRAEGDSIVDSKTAWELYYPPFQAAVDAGVAAVMCSYNKIDGEYACENQRQFDILKRKMGFQGFVQSDWWATHTMSLQSGLDQEMPGIGNEKVGSFFNNGHEGPSSTLTAAQEIHVDEAASRVLAVIHKLNLSATAKCTPPECGEWISRNVTSAAHDALALRAARESVVMLKNDDVLPLTSDKVRTIAVIGAPAAAKSFDPNGEGQGGGTAWAQGDYYSGGGSGHMTSTRVVSALGGLQRRAALAGIRIIVSATDSVADAIEAANQADVAIVVAATTSGEAFDRPNLRLDGLADELIEAVTHRSSCRKTVVLVQAPGAVLMPWRHSVSAILTMFLGGQETGNAWADVVFGDHAPTGRLPIMMPATEADTIPPELGDLVVYSEGLATSYRNTQFVAAYPFGHGLTYSRFEYADVTTGVCDAPSVVCVRCKVHNVGSKACRTVAQLYLELPADRITGQTAPAVLKGVQKTAEIAPGDYAEVIFSLTVRDLSYFDAASDDFVQAASAVAHIGESSADIRLHAAILLTPRVAAEAFPANRLLSASEVHV